ncbi:Csm3p [Saccharomyces eubayanus]|uniref:Csm3p n=1 Tax=Saccharomyces eubayanus TaxID=1080349 RepID=UPI0006C0BDEC|nr:CSM3-like protein [Saccharomyces eubayanus]KOG97390.1 CSM3-like protein [Saccharomyces eubayanus]
MDEESDNPLLAFNGSNGLQSDPTIPNGLDGSVADPTIADPTAIASKKRRPQVKLTAEKLLSDKGLPYVLKNAHKRIRISSRKNPYDNLSNIIQFYQLWAHELFPKAKFKDFMKICQTVGKTDPVLREYRVSLFRNEMGVSLNVDTGEAEQELETQEPITTEHADATNAELVTAASLNIQDNGNDDNGDDNEEDDDIYHLSASNRRKRVLDEEENDAAVLGTQGLSSVKNIPSKEPYTVLKKFKEQGPAELNTDEKKLLSRWLDEHRSMEKVLMTEEDIQLLRKLEDWEMNDAEVAMTYNDFVTGEDDFDIDQDEIDAMKEMGF